MAADEIMLSFEVDRTNSELRIAFDKAGAEHLIEVIRRTVSDGDHFHDYVGPKEISGALTRKHSYAKETEIKILGIQYQLFNDPDDWVD